MKSFRPKSVLCCFGHCTKSLVSAPTASAAFGCVAVHRAELLKHYDMQDNAEFILLYKLRQIGVDVEKWTAEPQTQKVVLKE